MNSLWPLVLLTFTAAFVGYQFGWLAHEQRVRAAQRRQRHLGSELERIRREGR